MRTTETYQLRGGAEQRPSDVVSDLAHAAWRALTDTPDVEGLDPHRWPGLYSCFQGVFKNRLVRYRDCGEGEERRGDFPHGPTVYTWEGRRDPAQLSRLLGGLARRRLKPRGGGRQFCAVRMARALEPILRERFHVGECGDACPFHKGVRDRRIWAGEEAGWV